MVMSFFPRGVLDEILNLIESVSEDFPSYSMTCFSGMIRARASGSKVHLCFVKKKGVWGEAGRHRIPRNSWFFVLWNKE